MPATNQPPQSLGSTFSERQSSKIRLKVMRNIPNINFWSQYTKARMYTQANINAYTHSEKGKRRETSALEEWLVTILQQEIGKVTLKHLTVPANRKKPRYNSTIV